MNVREDRVLERGYSREKPLPLSHEGWALFSLLAIMFLGLVLRLYGLSVQSLSGNELASWSFSEGDTISQLVGSDVQPPLYFFILDLTRSVFGDSEWALRLPSAVAGWLSIPALYLLGKKLYSEREGIMAALFAAVLWAPIYYSQEARPLSVLILLSILTSYFWWNVMLGLRYSGRLLTRDAVLYIVFAVLCAYAHYSGLLLVVLQGFALAALARGTLRQVLLVYAPVVLIYLPWLPGMVYQFRHGEQTGEPTLQALPLYFQTLVARSELLAVVAWTLLAFLLLRGWDDLRRRRKGGTVAPGPFLAAWAVVPFVVAFMVSLASMNVLTAENLLVSLPAVYLLLARAVTRTFSGRAAGIFQGTVAVGLAATCLAYLLFSMDYYTTPTKEQVREAGAYVVANQDQDTLVVRCDAGDRLDYYLNGGRNYVEACTAKDLPKIKSGVKEGGYREVIHFISSPQPDQQLVTLLQRTFQPVDYKRFDGASVVAYKVRKSVPASLPQPKPPASLPKEE